MYVGCKSARNAMNMKCRKQVHNNGLKMEITVDETTIMAIDDQGQSTINPFCKVDASNVQFNEDGLANLNDDGSMESQVIEKEPPMVSVAALNGSERQVDENLLNLRYSCNICGISLKSKYQFRHHKLTKHTEEKFQCPHCSKKFHFKKKFEYHASCCEDLKHSCDLCGQKFNLLSRLENHKERVHHGNRLLRNANIEGADCTEEQKQNSIEKIDADHEMVPRYECANCSKKFHCIKLYKCHSIACDPDQKYLSSRTTPDKSDPKAATENPSSEPSGLKCFQCGIEESSAITLARHILMHHDSVACDFCGITLSSLAQALHHLKTMHKESKLKCPHCSMQFSWKGRLQKHVSHCENEKVPCDFCGKMFKDVIAVSIHRNNVCRAYKESKKQEQQNAETSLGNETNSSYVMEKNSLPLVDSNLSQRKCYYCNEELSSPGYLKYHLKVCHKLTKCDICGITVLGLSGTKNHKIKCHLKPKHECPTCRKKFHLKMKYDAHCFVCEHRMYSCKLCGRTLKQFHAVKRHNKRYHPNETSLENIHIVQDQKQVQNNDLKKETTAEEAAIAARDDQGQSTVNSSSKVDVSNSHSNEHSLANLNDDDCMVNQVIDQESLMVSVAQLNDSSDKQVASEINTHSLVENLSNQLNWCNICGISLKSIYQIKHHMLTKHTEAKFQCPNCSRKFHFKRKLDDHASSCAGLKHSCDLCGQKFNLLSRVMNHKERVHHGNRPLRKANLKGADCTEEQKQKSVKKIDAEQNINSCIICRITFASTDELMKHKLTCPNQTNGHDDSMLNADEISLFHRVKRTQTKSLFVQDGEDIELKLEIKVEETMLQEQEYQVTNEDPGRSFATDLHPHGGTSKNVEAEDAEDLDNGINIKEEHLEEEEKIEKQTTTESAECYKVFSYRDESLVRQEDNDQFYPCTICGLTFDKKQKMYYHKAICHTEPRYKCSHCQKMFHYAAFLRRHEKGCSELRCKNCGIKFTSRAMLENHHIDKHPHDGESESNEIKVKEEYMENEEEILTDHQN